MLVDHVRRTPRVLRVYLCRDQHRGVTKRARIEDRGDLADDPLVEQPADPCHHLGLGDPGLLSDVRVWTRRDREGALHQVQQPAVELVKWDRRAVLARAQLGSMLGLGSAYCSHFAASFAW